MAPEESWLAMETMASCYVYGAAIKGDKFRISCQPGYIEKGGSPVIAKSIAPHLTHFGGK
ncbi:hypothetical protein KCTCHS21_13490 [Cohnella abietis]|uniref:Uncharacterized protein n=1 Tax=Cohnella abietis TaxID=2507935 RepID=A0A3T1D1I0_9BACL|nr:hypothetical protein KCTCHS21_13490 [Cohnella abietis]